MVWPVTEQQRIAWDPFRDLHRLQREMGRFFDSYADRGSEYPTLNLWAAEDEVVVTAEVPGIEPKDLQLTVQGDLLVLEGERPSSVPENAREIYRQERSAGRFRRSVRLPYEVAADSVKATYKNGIVTVTLPRSESTKPRRISISNV